MRNKVSREIKINRKGSQVVGGMNNNHLIYLSTERKKSFVFSSWLNSMTWDREKEMVHLGTGAFQGKISFHELWNQDIDFVSTLYTL